MTGKTGFAHEKPCDPRQRFESFHIFTQQQNKRVKASLHVRFSLSGVLRKFNPENYKASLSSHYFIYGLSCVCNSINIISQEKMSIISVSTIH